MSTNLESMPTRAIHLPELLDLIGNDLNTQELLSCAQVCRVWNQHFIPLLWANIDDRLCSCPTNLRPISLPSSPYFDDDNTWLNSFFTKYGRHIRHLSAGWAATITAANAAGTVTNLKSLTVFKPLGLKRELAFSPRGQTILLKPQWPSSLLQDFLPPTARKISDRSLSLWYFVQRFWSLVVHNPSLKSIELVQECQLEDFPIPAPSLLSVLSTLPNLTKLVNSMAALDLQMVLEHLPRLSFYSCPISWLNETSTTNSIELTAVFPHLQTLQLLATRGKSRPARPSLRYTTILNILEHLPNLDRLLFDEISMFVSPPPASIAENSSMLLSGKNTKSSGSGVQDFHFTYYSRVDLYSKRDFIALDILPRMPRLTRLSLQTLTQEAGNSLAKYCPQLESLRLRTTKYDKTEDDSITPLLHHCSQLKHLDAIWYTVDAYSLMKKPVVCRGMEVFRCQFTGIGEEKDEEEDYYDDLEDEDWENPVGHDKNDDDEEANEEEGEGEGESEETKTTRRQERLQEHLQYIYGELGRWTELRVFELGVDNVDWYDIMGSDPGKHLVDGRVYYNYFGPTPNTLPLSLESGLDRLRTLKKLEVIGFEGVDHRINTEELAWMAEYWPQLQVMHGLQAPDDKDEYALRCPKVSKLRAHMQVLRPLVRHEPGRS